MHTMYVTLSCLLKNKMIKTNKVCELKRNNIRKEGITFIVSFVNVAVKMLHYVNGAHYY